MAVPGISPLGGQPTLTNPLNQEGLLQGRVIPSQDRGETQSTVTASERSSTAISHAGVVEEAQDPQKLGFNTDNLGISIDIKV